MIKTNRRIQVVKKIMEGKKTSECIHIEKESNVKSNQRRWPQNDDWEKSVLKNNGRENLLSSQGHVPLL